MADQIIPGFSAFHPIGARLAQECVRITAGDFRCMIFQTQYHVPDLRPVAAARGRPGPGLPVAPHATSNTSSRATRPTSGSSSRRPTSGTWALTGEYPDAVVVQTHRDPLR